MGESHVQLAADGDHGVGIEAAVGPHGELSGRKWAAPRAVLARPSRSRAIM